MAHEGKELPPPQWLNVSASFRAYKLEKWIDAIRDAPVGGSTSADGSKVYRWDNGQVQLTRKDGAIFTYRPQGNSTLEVAGRLLVKWWARDGAITWTPTSEVLIQTVPGPTEAATEYLYRDDKNLLMVRLLNPALLAPLEPLEGVPGDLPYRGYASPVWRETLAQFWKDPPTRGLLRHAEREWGWKSGAIAVHLFSDRKAYLASAQSGEQSLGTAGEYGFTAAYEIPSQGTPQGPPHRNLLIETLLHESTHQLALSHCARIAGLPIKSGLAHDEPLWFTEGVAQSLPARVHPGVRARQNEQTRAFLVRVPQVSLAQIDRGDQHALYLVGGLMVEHLMQKAGSRRFRDFYDLYCRDGNFDAHLQSAYGLTPAKLLSDAVSARLP